MQKEIAMLAHTVHRSRATRWLAALPLAAATCAAHAQAWCTATLVYEPAPVPTSVPSLTTWAVLVLASVLALVAMQRMRVDASGKHWAVMLGLALVLATGSGGMVINQAIAATADLSNPAGGSVTLNLGGITTTLTNTTQVPLTIASITANAAPIHPLSTCKVGQQLAPGASCQVVTGNCTEPEIGD